MSRTTEILLHVAERDEGHAEDLSFWVRDEAPRTDNRVEGSAGYLLPLAGELGIEAWGGDKAPAVNVWAGVLNYVDLDAVCNRVEHMLWEEPQCLQLLMRDDGDPWFRFFMIRDGALRQYAPVPPPDDQDLPW